MMKSDVAAIPPEAPPQKAQTANHQRELCARRAYHRRRCLEKVIDGSWARDELRRWLGHDALAESGDHRHLLAVVQRVRRREDRLRRSEARGAAFGGSFRPFEAGDTIDSARRRMH